MNRDNMRIYREELRAKRKRLDSVIALVIETMGDRPELVETFCQYANNLIGPEVSRDRLSDELKHIALLTNLDQGLELRLMNEDVQNFIKDLRLLPPAARLKAMLRRPFYALAFIGLLWQLQNRPVFPMLTLDPEGIQTLRQFQTYLRRKLELRRRLSRRLVARLDLDMLTPDISDAFDRAAAEPAPAPAPTPAPDAAPDAAPRPRRRQPLLAPQPEPAPTPLDSEET